MVPPEDVIPDVNDVDEGEEVDSEDEKERIRQKKEFGNVVRRSKSIIMRYKEEKKKRWMIYPESTFHKIWDIVITM